MRRGDRIGKLMAFSILCAVIWVWAGANTTGSQPLEPFGMMGVRGSAPGDCTGNYTYRPCTESEDSSQSCWQADGKQAQCDQTKSCFGCTAANQHEFCSSNRPWNAICDPGNNGTLSDGCGKTFATGAKCQWYAVQAWCRCAGTASTFGCGRATAVRTDNPPGNCNLIP